MADREQPYDPYIPASGGGANAQQPGNHRNEAIQAVCLLPFSADAATPSRNYGVAHRPCAA